MALRRGRPDALAMTRTGDLRRVRRGLYWCGTPTRLGMAPRHPIASLVRSSLHRHRSQRMERLPGARPFNPNDAPRDDRRARTSATQSRPRPLRQSCGQHQARDERLRPFRGRALEVLRDWNALVEVSTHDAVDRIACLADNGTVRLGPARPRVPNEPPEFGTTSPSLRRARPTGISRHRSPARSESVHHDLALTG